MYGGPRVDRTDGAFCTIRLFRKNRLFCFKITNGTSTVVAATVYTRWRNWQSRQSSTWSAEVVRWPEWCTWWAQSIQSTAALATASWRCTPDSSCIDTNTDNSNHAMLILLRCLSISSAKVRTNSETSKYFTQKPQISQNGLSPFWDSWFVVCSLAIWWAPMQKILRRLTIRPQIMILRSTICATSSPSKQDYTYQGYKKLPSDCSGGGFAMIIIYMYESSIIHARLLYDLGTLE